MKKMNLKSNEITQEMVDQWNGIFTTTEHNDIHSDSVLVFDNCGNFCLTSSMHGVDDDEFVVMDYGCDGSEFCDMIDSVNNEKWTLTDLVQYLENTERL